jgi:sulfoxide reductase heme-binding subunit YedZ
MTLWYIARGAGLAALLLLTVSTCIGALMTHRGRAARGVDNRVVWHYVHRVTASLGLAVLTVHIGAILADSYAKVGWVASLVPFTSEYRPSWVGLGTLAVYTFIFVAAIGAARGRFARTPRGSTIWRGLHSLAYLGWAMAAWHGFASGTDSSVGWVRALYLGSTAAVVGCLLVRLGRLDRPGLVRHHAPAATPCAPQAPRVRTLAGAR